MQTQRMGDPWLLLTLNDVLICLEFAAVCGDKSSRSPGQGCRHESLHWQSLVVTGYFLSIDLIQDERLF